MYGCTIGGAEERKGSERAGEEKGREHGALTSGSLVAARRTGVERRRPWALGQAEADQAERVRTARRHAGQQR